MGTVSSEPLLKPETCGLWKTLSVPVSDAPSLRLETDMRVDVTEICVGFALHNLHTHVLYHLLPVKL
ncbi:hypothetical protein BOCO_0609 [Bombiscardovia coagulans]|uniref:Uncharacterized protein n=1 Tax=Bombiscardovia coagulans TaxID=686666 RepID=A0A261ET90_9BIFI|nr:hypothetical protein BOCO_0609 [Bombiscardovia coagulans]